MGSTKCYSLVPSFHLSRFLVYISAKFISFLIFLGVCENSSHDRIIAANPRIKFAYFMFFNEDYVCLFGAGSLAF